MMAAEGVLNELPCGWTWTKLEFIAEKINPGFPSGKHNKEKIGIPHIRPMNISPKGEIDLSNVKYVETLDYDSLSKGDVLFNNTNSPEMLGKTTYLKRDTNWAYSNHMTRIRLFQQFLEPAWVAYYLHHLFLNGFFKMNCVHHVNQASINSGFLSQRIPIPLAPLPEQHRIVARIEVLFSRLDAGVEALQKAKTQLKRYRQSVLKAAMEGRLTEEWRKEHPEVEPAAALLEHLGITKKDLQQLIFENDALQETIDPPNLPESWIWTTIGQIFRVYVGATPRRNEPDYWGGSIPWVSSGEVAFCRIYKTRETISPLGLENSSTKIHPPGTVLLGMIGEGKTRGQAAILEIAACNNQNSAAIRASESGLSPEYLYYYFENEYERTRKLSSGNNQPALNKKRVQSMHFPLPPLSEQQKIVEEIERCVSAIDDTEKTIKECLQRAYRFRQSILKRAFEGRLVPQDPTDEPASMLLERIRVERFSQVHNTSKRDRVHNTHQMRLTQ